MMDKNENGSTAQFSPEELIRRLKSQLNITTDQDSDNADNASADEKASEDVLAEEDLALPFSDEDETDEDAEAAEADTAFAEDPSEPSDISIGESELEEGDTAVFFDAEDDSDADDTDEETAVETAADEAVEEFDDPAVTDDGAAETNDGATVEFSISHLFNNAATADDTVAELSVQADAEKDKADDEVDFLSFLAASGISVKNAEDDAEAEDAATDLSDIAEELFDTTEADEALEPSSADIDEDVKPIDGEDEIAESPAAETEEACESELPNYDAGDDEGITPSPVESAVENAAEDTLTEVSEEALDTAFENEAAAADEAALAEIEPSDSDELDYSFDDEQSADTNASDEGKVLPDFNMLIALGIPVAEVEKIYGADAAEEYTRLTDGTGALDDLSDDEDVYEYTSRTQNEEIEAHHKREKTLVFVKLCAAAVLFIIALLFENLPALGAEYSGWLDQAAMPVVHIMIDLQLVLFAAVLAWDELASGIHALLRRSANVGTVLAAAVIMNILCDIALCFTRVAKYEVKLAGASVILAVFMCIGISALRLFVEARAFAMISQKGTRSCVLTESADDVRERNTFFDKISKEEASSAKVLSFGKTGFVAGFFGNQTSDKATVIDKILAPAAVVGAIIAFVISYAVSKSVGIGLYTFNCATAFLIPVAVFAAGTVTYFRAAGFAETMKAAIIGENAPYELADSSVVAFEDRDAYPSYCVKLRNLKVYGSIAIVDVLRMTTTAFRHIGGPLSDVLESATSEVNKDIPVDIVKSREGGIEAVYQGQRLLIGKADFLHSYGIIPYSDVDDREYLKTGDVSIMYVAYGDELSAKFYIQYTLDVDFEVLLRDLNRAGICVSIRTSDPNIDKRLLQAKLNLNRTSLRIVYREPCEGRSEPTEETVSAVIGTGTPSELIHTAMLCDRVVHVYRTNTIVKALSLIVGLALLILFALISVNVNVFSGLLIIYQLFWMIPTLIVSKLFL